MSDKLRELPEDCDYPSYWATALLSEVCHLVTDGTHHSPPNLPEGDYPYITAKNIKAHGLDTTELTYVTEEVHKSIYTRCPVEYEDVLYIKDGVTTGLAAVNHLNEPFSLLSSVALLKPIRELLDPYYLKHWLNSPVTFSKMTASMTGSAIRRLVLQKIRSTELPIPPLNEQKRIVAKIEELNDRHQRAKQALEAIPELCDRFRQSVLAAAFRGDLTADWREENSDVEPASVLLEKVGSVNQGTKVRRGVPQEVVETEYVSSWTLPETWTYASAAKLLRIGALIDLKDGNHGGNHPKVSDFTPDGLPFITAAQVKNFQVDYEGAYKISGEPLKKLKVGFSKPGDVIYTHKGSVGRVAIAKQECVLTPQTTYYRASTNVLYNRYLMWYLASPYFTAQVDAIKSQTTRDFVPITEQFLLFHLIPPIDEQVEIAKRIEALFNAISQIEQQYQDTEN